MKNLVKKITPDIVKHLFYKIRVEVYTRLYSRPKTMFFILPRFSYFRDIKRDPVGNYFAFLETMEADSSIGDSEQPKHLSNTNRLELIFSDIDVNKIIDKGLRVLIAGCGIEDFCIFYDRLGSLVHFCHSNPGIIKDLKRRFPNLVCWEHDFNFPWSHKIKKKYDIVVALDLLNQVADPKSLLHYFRQVAPLLYVDGIVIDSSKPYILHGAAKELPERLSKFVRNIMSSRWLENQLKLLDFMVTTIHGPNGNSDTELYDWEPLSNECCTRDGKVLRRLYACERLERRTNLMPLLVHVHLPKNAGSSLLNLFRDSFGDRHCDLYFEDPRVEHTFHSIVSQLQVNPGVISISSHSFTDFPPLLGYRIPLYICFLRNPIDRHMSYYRYCKKNYALLTKEHRMMLPNAFLKMSVRNFFEWKAEHEKKHGYTGNHQVQYFARANDLKKATEVLSNFFFVGIVEELDRSVSLLRKKLQPYGIYLIEKKLLMENATPEFYLETKDSEEDALIRSYIKNLESDIMLYEWAKCRFAEEATNYGI